MSDDPEPVPTWVRVFRDGFAPGLPTAGVVALRDALAADDPRLVQGRTTTPPPLPAVRDWPVEGACPVGFCGWRGEGLASVGEVEDFFADQCRQADVRLDGPGECQWFLSAWDDTPRAEVRAALLAEVGRELARRGVPG